MEEQEQEQEQEFGNRSLGGGRGGRGLLEGEEGVGGEAAWRRLEECLCPCLESRKDRKSRNCFIHLHMSLWKRIDHVVHAVLGDDLVSVGKGVNVKGVGRHLVVKIGHTLMSPATIQRVMRHTGHDVIMCDMITYNALEGSVTTDENAGAHRRVMKDLLHGTEPCQTNLPHQILMRQLVGQDGLVIMNQDLSQVQRRINVIHVHGLRLRWV